MLAAAVLAACGGPASSTPPAPSTSALASVAPAPSASGASASASASPSASVSASPSASSQATATVYFSSQGKLVAEQAKVAEPSLRNALDALLKGPSQPGHLTEIPQGTKLLDVKMEGDTAQVNLSPEFFAGTGETAVDLRLGQVVYTATSFPNVHTVQLLDAGQMPPVVGEGLNVARPLTRDSLRGVSAA